MNPVDKKIPLMECFGPTIQGEGAVIGQQTYFLRFGLCDYKCTMCDSMHAVDPLLVSKNAEWLTQDEIFNRLNHFYKPFTTKWITLSGGNPAIHDLDHLIDLLQECEWKTAVETQGTIYHEWLNKVDVLTVSPKGPGMGVKFDLEVFERFMQPLRFQEGLNIKVVIFGDADLEFAEQIADWLVVSGYPLDIMYLSQGNLYPPGKAPDDIYSGFLHRDILCGLYLETLKKIQSNPDKYHFLQHVKFLPQWHVWLWGNRQGV